MPHGQQHPPTWFDPPAIIEPHVAIEYVALCLACPWQGRGRASNLRALADFDAHIASDAHRELEENRAEDDRILRGMDAETPVARSLSLLDGGAEG